ncbi:MAG: efflux RND transporter periplasmic adaptor subunit [Polyangiaceae bacterium]|nr:efflux RND transporter periplasmic adaptor subunit [Polyangiaceae bacterium]
MSKNKKKRFIIASVLAVVLASSVGGYVYSREPNKAPAGPTVEVQRGSLRETAAASGTIAPHVSVEVKSRASGEVVEILVQEGDTVKAGQLLVRLDPTDAERDLASAKVALDKVKADLSAAKASVTVAQLEYKTKQGDEALATKSAELGLGTKDAVRTTATTTKVAAANITLKNAQVTASETNLKTAELAVQDAETRLKETKIYAPIDGTVLAIPVEKGTIVSSALTNVSGGTSVMTIADLSDLRIIGAIDEAQIGKVAKGQPVEIRVDAYPERVFEGTVERVSPLGKDTSSVVTFDVEILVADKNSSLLRSGMSADVEIVVAEQKDVLLVPLIAVETSGRSRFVRLANGEQRPIKTGTTDGTRMVVLEGISEGDDILASAPASTSTAAATPPPGGGMGMMGGPGGGNRSRSGGGGKR